VPAKNGTLAQLSIAWPMAQVRARAGAFIVDPVAKPAVHSRAESRGSRPTKVDSSDAAQT
jgi:hypothetical protein